MTTHYIITNREIIPHRMPATSRSYYPVNANESIRTDGSEEAIHSLRYGLIKFEPGKAKSLKDFDIQIHPDITPDESEEIRENEDKLADIKPGSFKMFNSLHRACTQKKKNGHVLVYVHGFNNKLEDALITLQKLHQLYVEDPSCPIDHLVLFTWPSMDKKLKYRDDFVDAQRTGYAMARSFLMLRSFFKTMFKVNLGKAGSSDKAREETLCDKKIHLLCHSLGCKVFECMLSALDFLNQRTATMFAEIILTGADVDYDCFEKPKHMYKAVDLAERVHVYYHNKDRALDISEKTKNALNRLGRWGIKDSLNLPDDLFEYDISHIGDETEWEGRLLHHSYYINSRAVVEDIKALLIGERSVFNI